MLTQQRLKDLLSYEPTTGVFTWRVERNSHGGVLKPGDIAGHTRDNGYIIIGIDGKIYRAHRLVWLYTYGAFPSERIDHINGQRGDNRLKNLREISNAQNAQNLKSSHRDSGTGVLGVSKHTQCNRYVAQICIEGKQTYLGLFETKAEAQDAYIAAKREHHAGAVFS